jgi:hypothetical protein
MNWKRLAILSVTVFVATGVAAFPFGFIRGVLAARGERAPAIVDAAQGLAVPCVGDLVFAVFSFVHRVRTLEHVMLAAAVVWGGSSAVNYMLTGTSAPGGLATQALLTVIIGLCG